MNLLPDALRGKFFRGFTPDTDPEEAAAIFKARYGRQPEWILDSLGVLYVGPIPEVLA